MSVFKSARIHVTGIVQGVGFRPFVYNLATQLGLFGWVQNTSAGVDIEIDGPEKEIQDFLQSLKTEAPPLAKIDAIQVASGPPNGFSSFEIIHSAPIPEAFQPISPDVAICSECLQELRDPADRRYRYPFINCTNCGPRFTIIIDIPYDRPNTTMAGFKMCPECAQEYTDPLNRRFHAQPVACPRCGPGVWLEVSGTRHAENDAAIIESQKWLSQGKILAIKGLGGFHLACDAENQAAVDELRARKLRVDKPFALMMADIETVQSLCFVSDAERDLLQSKERPIVILQRRSGSSIAPQVAPNQDTLGVMLPYTPLHYLLFEARPSELFGDTPASNSPSVPKSLVMTSGNLSEEPIAYDNAEARQRLSSLADAFLMHDRPIRTRCDDSVVRVLSHPGEETEHGQKSFPILYPLRRSRGYSPSPIHLSWESPSVLATGTELKNTFCLTRDHYAFISHHIGDLENYETLQSFEDGVAHYERLFRIHPEAIAYDLHPDYLATQYALRRAKEEGLPSFSIQHHHAHIAACLADNNVPLDQQVIGVAFDGTGYGDDGAIWGGEFLLAGYTGYQRAAHLTYTSLPGGDAATRKPARIALALLWHAGLEWDPGLPSMHALRAEKLASLRVQLEHKVNTPQTSSMGRLFDGIAALAGVRQTVNYEAQAAIEFENLVDPAERGSYPMDYFSGQTSSSPIGNFAQFCINPTPLIKSVVSDLGSGVPIPIISARFHNGIALMVSEVSSKIRKDTGINAVALSGGVWQNLTLLGETIRKLKKDGFHVYTHNQVPTNDGGVALGQAMIASAKFTRSGE